jgi:hypothetical protein
MNIWNATLLLALVMAGLTACPSTPSTPASTPGPKISSFIPDPVTLASSGGAVKLNWSAIDATGFTVSVTPSAGATGLPVGRITATNAAATLPANTTAQPIVYAFTLTASGATGTTPVNATAQVTVNPVPAATTGSLTVNVNGLPSGSDASVTVTDPNGFIQTLTATTTLSKLVPGSYAVSAASVTVQGAVYTATVVGSPATVSAGQIATSAVTYTTPKPRILAAIFNPSVISIGESGSVFSWMDERASSYTLSIQPGSGVRVAIGAGSVQPYTGPINFTASDILSTPVTAVKSISIIPPDTQSTNLTSAAITLTANGPGGSVSKTLSLSREGTTPQVLAFRPIDRPVYALTRGQPLKVSLLLSAAHTALNSGQLNFALEDADGQAVNPQDVLRLTSFTMETVLVNGVVKLGGFQVPTFTPPNSARPGIYTLIVTPQTNDPQIPGAPCRLILVVQ